jgi:hypothetical protein
MTIATFDDYLNALRQTVRITVATSSNWAAMDLGSTTNVAVGNTANGSVPVAGSGIYPAIQSTSGRSFIAGANLVTDAVGGIRIFLYDRLFDCGAYQYSSGATTTLTSQPSFASRVPGSNYHGMHLFAESVGLGGGSGANVKVDYTNQDGVAGRTTGTVNLGNTTQAPTIFRLPLQGSDTGLQSIQAITVTGGYTGTTNIVVARPLMVLRGDAPSEYAFPMEITGMVEIYETSALFMTMMKEGNSSVRPNFVLDLEIVSG